MNKTTLLFVLCCFFSVSLLAQNSDKPKEVTQTYFLQNVNIVPQPGQMITKGHLIVRDGIIENFGQSLSIPADAEVIKADSMFVYAGFIDALSHTAIPKEEDKKKSDNKNPGNPTNEEAGILPDRQAADLVSAEEGSIEKMRNLGFGISHVVPKGNMLPGSGATIVLNGKSGQGMVIQEDVSTFGQFKGSGRWYPQTIIGVLAKWKDLYRNAEVAKEHSKKYAMNPSGLARPSHDAATKALFPVIDKQKSIYIKANSHLDASRALKLQKDLGFNMVLCDLKQGWNLIDKIKVKNVPVLLSIDIPEKEKEDKKKKDEEKSEEKSEDKKEDKKEEEQEEDVDLEVEAFKERKKKSIANYIGQAAAFEKAGIPFSFSFLSGKGKDLQKNLRAMVEEGLSESAALAALTTNPAKLLGIQNIAGTIARGKMANLVVTENNYFDEKSKIRYVFVEGQVFKFEEKKKKKKKKGDAAASGLNIEGEWSYKMEIPTPENEGTMTIKKSDSGYTVTLVSPADPDEPETIEDVELDGDTMTFSFDVTDGMQMTIEMELTFTEESFEGTITAGQFGSFPMSGEKISGPKN